MINLNYGFFLGGDIVSITGGLSIGCFLMAINVINTHLYTAYRIRQPIIAKNERYIAP